LDAHKHLAGSKKGNTNHYVEQHERGDTKNGIFQKKSNKHLDFFGDGCFYLIFFLHVVFIYLYYL
jgi:hypothetical protein